MEYADYAEACYWAHNDECLKEEDFEPEEPENEHTNNTQENG
jgi:hypothetical protein